MSPNPSMRRSLALLAAATILVAGVAHAHPLEYRIDTVHSQVLFSASHDGFSRPVGRLKVARGWLRFDPDDWSNSKVVVDIAIASADLGDKGWDGAVTGHWFLDASKFPLAHFASTSVRKTGEHAGTLTGNLSLHGVTLPVTIEFTVNRVGTTIFGFETIAGFSGTATLDRTRFGMTAFPHAVGTEVAIRLEIEATWDPQAENTYQQAAQQAATAHPDAAAQH